MNQKVHDNWREQDFKWYRAIWVECAELMDHYGWKWWKKQEPDIEQVKLELVDIWHFGLSDMLQREAAQDIAQTLAGLVNTPLHTDDFRTTLERFAEATLNQRRFMPSEFFALLNAAELPFTELYRHYIGKNVLNFFRQDHGYQDGSYIKVWHGREDNEHLAQIVQSLSADADDYQEQVYQALSERYPKMQTI